MKTAQRSAQSRAAIGKLNATLLALAAAGAPCLAGTIRNDRLDADYRAYANQPQFASVGSDSTGSLFGSFTLIAPDRALTAAHVVDTDGDGLVSDEVITNDTLRIGAQQRLDQPFTAIGPAALYTSFQELGKTITSVGFGQGGTETSGATTSSGIKRAGDNVVDQYNTFANGAPRFAGILTSRRRARRRTSPAPPRRSTWST